MVTRPDQQRSSGSSESRFIRVIGGGGLGLHDAEYPNGQVSCDVLYGQTLVSFIDAVCGIVRRHLAPNHKTRIRWTSGSERGGPRIRGKNRRDGTDGDKDSARQDPARHDDSLSSKRYEQICIDF